ncbi:MAG: hypothetical protein ACT4OK_20915 [Gemmobacter sp.]
MATSDIPEGLGPEIERLRGSVGRVVPIDLGRAGRFWLKQVEVLTPRMRLQKGNPARALDAERDALVMLAGIGMPVAEVVVSGDGYLVLPDHGRTLHQMLQGGADVSELTAAFAAAGRSLARLHRAGYAHGRPALRDICWDGQQARLIDLENFDPRRRRPWRRALDMVMLAQTWFTRMPDDESLLDVTMQAYRTHAAPADWAALQRLAARLGRLSGPVRMLAGLRPRAREVQAAGRTLDYLRRLTAQPAAGSSGRRGPDRGC